MSDLVEWLREQLRIDEVTAEDCVGDDVAEWVAGETADNGEPYVGRHFANWLPSRVLAEVEAKRRILDEIVDEANSLESSEEQARGLPSDPPRTEPYLGDQLLLLAAPFRGRPGWRDEWEVA